MQRRAPNRAPASASVVWTSEKINQNEKRRKKFPRPASNTFAQMEHKVRRGDKSRKSALGNKMQQP
jgi:hypothetical protein